MIQNVLRHLGGIENYGILSLCLFFSVFTGVFIWACLLRKSHLDRVARIPLDTDSEPSHEKGNSHD